MMEKHSTITVVATSKVASGLTFPASITRAHSFDTTRGLTLLVDVIKVFWFKIAPSKAIADLQSQLTLQELAELSSQLCIASGPTLPVDVIKVFWFKIATSKASRPMLPADITRAHGVKLPAPT
ncbi:hypothetical protein J1N35_005718 [Gossypium stocksii]|uniref:Uncharacterized protein n=1 Tax=Gossypium stocksii TaxID=47602 RepID=A0A9D3WFS6_9ROSI|nr:hypothetical protein J1N35_005718 [Gossypium stocksii]